MGFVAERSSVGADARDALVAVALVRVGASGMTDAIALPGLDTVGPPGAFRRSRG
jgi:hypothetical protein